MQTMIPFRAFRRYSASIPLAREKKEEGGRILFRHLLLPLGRRIRKTATNGSLKNTNPPHTAIEYTRHRRNGEKGKP
jgi:hypothetical protein